MLIKFRFTVDDTGDGSEGLSMVLSGKYSLLILDLMLPSVDGTTILKAIIYLWGQVR
jgi:DNA-binding response OmpR family regulator